MERQKPNWEMGFVLRFHHLGEMQDFVLAYLKSLDGVKPWELSPDGGVLAKEFVERYVAVDFAHWESARSYVEQLSYRGNPARKLRYIYDLIGTSEEDRERVIDARVDVFTRLLSIAAEDKKSKIPLTIDADDYCKACAVGKHCQRSKIGYLIKHDRDYIFRKSVNSLAKVGFAKDKLVYDESGQLYITPELLFDKGFYQALWTDIRDKGNGGWL